MACSPSRLLVISACTHWVSELRPHLLAQQSDPVTYVVYKHHPASYIFCENNQAHADRGARKHGRRRRGGDAVWTFAVPEHAVQVARGRPEDCWYLRHSLSGLSIPKGRLANAVPRRPDSGPRSKQIHVEFSKYSVRLINRCLRVPYSGWQLQF